MFDVTITCQTQLEQTGGGEARASLGGGPGTAWAPARAAGGTDGHTE